MDEVEQRKIVSVDKQAQLAGFARLSGVTGIVVVCSMIISFTNAGGFLNTLFTHLGYSGKPMLSDPNLFVPVYVASGIWQGMGWDSILYIAALAGIDQQLYEAASIDGASRWHQMVHVTLPGIAPTFVTMFILRMGGLMNVGYEKIILLYSPITYSSADVISSYVYRMGIERMNYSSSTAVGLFNSAINILLLLITNWFSKKVSETSLF